MEDDKEVKRQFFSEGDSVKFVCDEDYELGESRTGKCLPDGTWSRKALCQCKL